MPARAGGSVLRAMREVHFPIGGASRTYLDFYVGFGLSLSVFLLLQAVVLWRLATLEKSGSAGVRPIVAAFLLASLAFAFVSWKFILPVPAVVAAVIAVFLTLALLPTGR
jgi:hypothetical protein